MDKYEYLTGEDLGYKTGVIEQAKFEYSPLGKVFNKGLEKEDKKEGLLKRLKNIEGKNKEQLKKIEDKKNSQLDIKSMIDFFNEELSQKEKNIFIRLNNQKIISYKRLSFKRDKNLEFDFGDYKSLKNSLKGFIIKVFQYTGQMTYKKNLVMYLML